MSSPNTLKVRNDDLFRFEEQSSGRFESKDPKAPSWAEKPFGFKELRSQIEPWLTSLAQSEHLAILAGAGLTHAVHHLALGKPATGMSKLSFKSAYASAIDEAARKTAARAVVALRSLAPRPGKTRSALKRKSLLKSWAKAWSFSRSPSWRAKRASLLPRMRSEAKPSRH
jgi:hypothetical protein